MALQHDLELLKRVPLLEGFPDEQLRLIAFGSERELIRAGRELYRLGDESHGGYVVAGGQIDLVVYRGNREIVVDSRHEAMLVGELGLITTSIRATSAVSRTNSEVLFVPRALFQRMLNSFPESAAILHARISATVHTMLEQLQSLHAEIEKAPRFRPTRRR
jgi:CRP-like cAMP-binding protein